MDSRLAFALGLLLVAGLAVIKADEFNESQGNLEDESAELETSALVQNDAVVDPIALKKKGFCQWTSSIWHKPGIGVRCSCMKCVCSAGGNWDCKYNFAYCPYFFCGNNIYNPKNQLCCCGKAYTKKNNFKCCGYNYYDGRRSKCCHFFSVKSKTANCPRHKI